MNISIGLDTAARIVAIADDIRQNIKAKGEEAQRQFEEAVLRNKESFAEMIAKLGGYPAEPPPQPIPPVTPPVTPTPPPITPPTPPPVTPSVEYGRTRHAPILDDAALKAEGKQVGDVIHEYHANSMSGTPGDWLVQKPGVLANPGMRRVREIA